MSKCQDEDECPTRSRRGRRRRSRRTSGNPYTGTWRRENKKYEKDNVRVVQSTETMTDI